MKRFTVYTASSLDDALAYLAEYGEETRVLAGGTDLLVWRREGKVRESRLLDISALDELRYLRAGAAGLEIGALTTHSQVVSSPLVQERAPLLGEACHTVGSVQIRNRGTLGGNLVTASPAGDTIPALFCLGARVLLASVRGSRQVPVEEFFLGPGRTVRQSDELVTGVLVPGITPDGGPDAVSGVPDTGSGTVSGVADTGAGTAVSGERYEERYVYLKLGQRNALSISIASVAVRLWISSQGGCLGSEQAAGAGQCRQQGQEGRQVCRRRGQGQVCRQVAVAFGAVAPTVVRASRVEEALTGVPLDEVVPKEVASLAREEVRPITDIRASAEYRREMVVVLLTKALRRLRGETA
ncbi:MAG TPA: xanthine dehydrogenase family protein subunit M [Firmicutes bacterium]|nr:xanthine dehydrogenase family protein subunit M [Bacillota bacterium]